MKKQVFPSEKNADLTLKSAITLFADCFCVQDAWFTLCFGPGLRAEEPNVVYYLAVFDPKRGSSTKAIMDKKGVITPERIADLMDFRNSPADNMRRQAEHRVLWLPADGNPNGGIARPNWPWMTHGDCVAMRVDPKWQKIKNLKRWAETWIVYCHVDSFLRSFVLGNLDAFAMEIGKGFTMLRKPVYGSKDSPDYERLKANYERVYRGLLEAATLNGWKWTCP